MAMTKAEAAKLTNDLLLRGVVETIVKESSVLQLLPFMEVTGMNRTEQITIRVHVLPRPNRWIRERAAASDRCERGAENGVNGGVGFEDGHAVESRLLTEVSQDEWGGHKRSETGSY